MKRSIGKFSPTFERPLRYLRGNSPRCGTVYRRIEELEAPQQDAVSEHDQENNSEDEEERGRSRVKRMSTEEIEDFSILQFRRLRILTHMLTIPSGWVWDRFELYRMSRFSLQAYLNDTFGAHDFRIEV
jgi:hypothetical protein